jgi:DNA-binding NarL/FixJ family response regulator
MTCPRVVIVDDHELFRIGVRARLEPHVEVAGEAGSVEQAVALIRTTRPDVVLLDVHMPGGGGLAVLSTIVAELPTVRFLALSMSDAPEDVIEIVHAGARGYVTKTIPASDLTEAVQRVAEGDAVFSPRLAGFVLDAFAGADGIRAAPLDPDLAQLTPREREVLHLIARGYLYKEAAQELSISTKTIETHVSAVLRKLQLSNRHQLTRWAAERRLID